MLEKLPKVTDKVIANQTEEMRERVNAGGLTKWLDEQLSWMANNNKALYKYIVEHSQKFASGAVVVGDVQAIAMSHALEQISLLCLLASSIKDAEELQNFQKMVKGWFGENIEGLDDLGEKNT